MPIAPLLASRSTFSLPAIPECPGTQNRVTFRKGPEALFTFSHLSKRCAPAHQCGRCRHTVRADSDLATPLIVPESGPRALHNGPHLSLEYRGGAVHTGHEKTFGPIYFQAPTPTLSVLFEPSVNQTTPYSVKLCLSLLQSAHCPTSTSNGLEKLLLPTTRSNVGSPSPSPGHGPGLHQQSTWPCSVPGAGRLH